MPKGIVPYEEVTATVKILATRAIEGRNVWIHAPVLQARLSLSPHEQAATDELAGFTERLLDLLPGLRDHTCGRGYPGGFVERLQEGTYLGHVVEHVALELQALAGFPVTYGKTLRGPEPGTWDLVLEYGTRELGVAALEAAVSLVTAVLVGRHFPLPETMRELESLGERTRPGPSTESILRACREREIPVISLNGGLLFQLGYGRCQRRIQGTITSFTSALAVDLACDKESARRLLEDAGLPVPAALTAASLTEAVAAARRLGYPVVVKPRRGNQGKGVCIELNCDRETEAAFRIARNYDEEVLVEKYIPGRHYRLLVIGGKVVAAAERFPAAVIGDGEHTIRELVELVNRDPRRGEGHGRPLTRLEIDPVAVLELARQGYTSESRPEPGRTVFLRRNANLSTGGSAADVTDCVHPDNALLAVRAAEVLGLDVAGVDLVAPDISRSMRDGEGGIIEVNAAPGFRMHLSPNRGRPRDVGRALVDYLFPPGSEVSIPVIAVTGTNGKTTTTRILGHLFRQQGLTVGMTTTGGVYVNDRCLLDGDTTGPDSARLILQNPQIAVAVLETARGGILRGGLGYDRADVAVVTNIGPDHLGQDGIETLEDLFWVKSLVVEAVKGDGHVILNADDPFSPRFARRARGEVVYFSLHEDNILVRRHLSTGGCAVFVREGSVYLGRGEKAIRLLRLQSIRAGMGGRALHNLENALAAAAAAWVAGVPPAVIRKGLRTFGSDHSHNPGRLMIHRVGRVTVIVDYGHNAPAFRRISEFVRTLKPRRLIGIVGVPGDRRDDQIIDAGEVAGKGFDELYIREDRDLRGRQPGETSGLLYKGARRAGLLPEVLHVIPDATDALREALRRAEPGDVVVVFYEELEPVLKTLRSAKGQEGRPEAPPQKAASQS